MPQANNVNMANGSAEVPENIYCVEIIKETLGPEQLRARVGELLVEEIEINMHMEELLWLGRTCIETAVDSLLELELKTLTAS